MQDPLILLPNRRVLDEDSALAIAQAFQHNRQCIMAMADVEKFNRINDSHAIGDKVLSLIEELPLSNLPTAHNLMEHLRECMIGYKWVETDPDLQTTISDNLAEAEISSPENNSLEKP